MHVNFRKIFFPNFWLKFGKGPAGHSQTQAKIWQAKNIFKNIDYYSLCDACKPKKIGPKGVIPKLHSKSR